jgi:lipoprotein signal peptidase
MSPIPQRVAASRATHVARRLALWVALGAGADAGSKWTASVLHTRGVLPGLIVSSRNPDFSMGVASASRPVMVVLALGFLVAFGGWCVHLALSGRLSAWIAGLLIGGAIANLADRAAFGSVHDWLRLGHVDLNVADLLVLIGVIGWVLALSTPWARRVPHSSEVGSTGSASH